MFMFLCLIFPSAASGFAAWLKCDRQLEPDEIIMNSKVRNAGDDKSSSVKMAIYDESGSTRIDTATYDKSGGATVWIDGEDPFHLSFKIGLDQSTLNDLADIQYVVESTQSFHTSPSPMPPSSPNVPTIHTKQSKTSRNSFTSASIGGGVLCDGKRAHARGKNGTVTFTITSNKSIDSKSDDVIAEVRAGWSEYHGAVTLTPRIVFKRRYSEAADMNDMKDMSQDHGEL